MNKYRPPRGAWRNLSPGETPEQFRDEDDENEYYDFLALEEYTTSTRRQFVLSLNKRQPEHVRSVSLEKLLWELPGMGGATSSSAKGYREVDEALGVTARTVLVKCAGYKIVETNAANMERLLKARNVDPLCLFLTRLLSVPNVPMSEAACLVLLSLVQAPGRSSLRDLSSMDMGEMTRLLLVRIYRVFGTRGGAAGEDEEEEEEEEEEEQASREEGKYSGNAYTKKEGGKVQSHRASDDLTATEYSQGFHMLAVLLELIQVEKALPWIRHGVVQLIPALLEALVPDGAHGAAANDDDAAAVNDDAAVATDINDNADVHAATTMKDQQPHHEAVVSATYSSACRDLDSFEMLCRIITNLSKDKASATLMRDADFVDTWFWMLRERRRMDDFEYQLDKIGGRREGDEHQRRVVRTFFDVLWEWTFTEVLGDRIKHILTAALERTEEREEEREEDRCSGLQHWVEDEFDVISRHLHPGSDLVMQSCGILWNCFGSKDDVVMLESNLLQRGAVEKIARVMLESKDCGALTCCAGALRNLVQTDSLTFHVSSQEGLVDHIKWLKITKNAEELVQDQKDLLLGDPALRYRGVEEKPSAGLAASAVSVNSKTSKVVSRLTQACNLVLKRLMGDDDEELTAIERRWGKK